MSAMNRHPPPPPGQNAGNAQLRPNSGAPNNGQQDAGPYAVGQDLTHLHPQHQFPTRPVFYVPAPPPPPFLQYQWPMPFSYNPFTGFPGMSYGMVIPPFPPPTYMDAPAYILPHPHIQPVDYRRLLHPQAHATQGVPFPNPNQPRRVRPAFAPVQVRETVNSEVQTEPQQRGGYRHESPLVGTDSGHMTASNTPSSLTSSSQKRGSTEVGNFDLPNNKDYQDKMTGTEGSVEQRFNVLCPSDTKSVKSCTGMSVHMQKSVQEKVSSRNSHCNMWSMSSSDSIVPMCSSSQQKDEVVKERRVSVPDILMTWGGGTPQALGVKMVDKMAPQIDQQLPSYETEVEPETSLYQSLTEYQNVPGADHDDSEDDVRSRGSENLLKILKLPLGLFSETGDPSTLVGSEGQCVLDGNELLYSLCDSQVQDEQENGDETDLLDDMTEIVPFPTSLNALQMKRKMNESVWSVESLVPFFPNKHWLQQNGLFETKVIQEAKNGPESTQHDKLLNNSSRDQRQSHRFSSSDSVQISDSCLIYSTPDKMSVSKKQSEMNTSETHQQRQGGSMSSILASPTCLPSEKRSSILPVEDIGAVGSSELEANLSPNQTKESIIVKEREKPHTPDQEDMFTLHCTVGVKTTSVNQLIHQNSVKERSESDVACGSTKEVVHVTNEQLHFPTDDMQIVEVSPSKRYLVDCGIQCTELQERCLCEIKCGGMGARRRSAFKHSDMKKANDGNAEGVCMSRPMQKNQRRQWRNNREGKRSRAASRSPTTSMVDNQGKSRGGNGRNLHY